MLNLHTSNRLEELAARLADVAGTPLSSPFKPEVILVQSQGMARWLNLQLAERHGICSHCQFPFPRAFSYAAFHAAIPGLPVQPAYDVATLVWQVMQKLPQLSNRPGFETVRNYLTDDLDGRKRFQLSQKVAHVLDQYLVFRPELILDWESKPPSEWQGQLWREISASFQQEHPAALRTKLISALRQGKMRPADLPERLSVFGISALPPFHLSILNALAELIPVHFFVLEPCREFWGYIRSDSEQQKMLKKAGRPAMEAVEVHLEKGNQLLASMGKLGRDFLLLIQETGDWVENDSDLFQEPGSGSMLAAIQSDVLNLRDRGQSGTVRLAVSSSDDSVQVHSCHNPLRELEVLYDHLLSWFQKDPSLAPRDVLVMIPDIESYAPLVRAVFESPEREDLRIPFSVADRGTRSQSQLIENFLSLIALADSRLGAGSVLALLESAALRNRFGLIEGDLELIRRWIEAVRIRWGQNEAQRVELGLPAWDENTWHAGLQRLLLGYAMAGKGERLFHGILPYDDIEGRAGELLGKFLEFMHQLFEMRRSLSIKRSVPEWICALQSILETFYITSDAQATELQALRHCFESFRSCGERAGFEEKIGLAVVLEQLTQDLTQDHFGAGYLTGGVTFCALKPMRSIPAKIICLLGMDNSAFPRSSPALSFDLMLDHRRLGDRSSRDDDRYLFLETLISARERLYLSYVGQSIRDNSVAPPSVVVSELLDYISQGFEAPGEGPILDQVCTRHRLQAFSSAYFSGGRMFSYSRENLQASLASRPDRAQPAPFIAIPLAEPEPEWRRLNASALIEFFCAPAKYLSRKRLRIDLPPRGEALPEREPFSLDHLERYGLETELLELKLGGKDLAGAQELVRCSGRLPAGKSGEASFAQLCRVVESFVRVVKPYLPLRFEAPLTVEIEVGDFRLAGHFGRITPTGLLSYRPATVKPTDLIRAWVEHLLWSASNRDPNRAVSLLVAKNALWKFGPVLDAKPMLETLLALYWRGLCQPLKFFPRTSFAFAQADFKARLGAAGRAKKSPLDCARTCWEGDDYETIGENRNDYIALLFRDQEPLDEEFEQIARAVFGPLLKSAEISEL